MQINKIKFQEIAFKQLTNLFFLCLKCAKFSAFKLPVFDWNMHQKIIKISNNFGFFLACNVAKSASRPTVVQTFLPP